MKTNLINISWILIAILFVSLPDTALGLNQKKGLGRQKDRSRRSG